MITNNIKKLVLYVCNRCVNDIQKNKTHKIQLVFYKRKK